MKIYVWINSGRGTDWQVGMAMAEDGTYLASHVSSSEGWFRHDMGLTGEWKHDRYKKHCPDGYELIEVTDPKGHDGLAAAYALNQSRKSTEAVAEDAASTAAVTEKRSVLL